MRHAVAAAAAIVGGSMLGACAAQAPAPQSNASPSAMPMVAPTTAPSDRVSGYLPGAALPSSVSLVPAPPAAGSAAMSRDEELNRSALTMQGSERWKLATSDAVLAFPQVVQTFSCALGMEVDEQRAPKLFHLMRRTLSDAGRSTSEAKVKYKRARPFMVNGKPLCSPDREAVLRADGSYPSGHSAIGWAFGLVLSEVSPDQANALLRRGRAFGESRLVCNVHWLSDVQEGQMMAAAVVARMHAQPEFRTDVDAARVEVAALRASNAGPPHNCAAEAQALQSWN